jgi:uncharacterized protein YraI
MRSRSLVLAIVAGISFPAAAWAEPGIATGDVNMRTGPGTGNPVITMIPAGSPVEVFGCPTWCRVAYAGHEGWASSNYISTGYAERPRVIYEPTPPTVAVYDPYPFRYVYGSGPYTGPYWRGHHHRPGWDDDYGYWRDDYRWRHRRHGISFEFGFGG